MEINKVYLLTEQQMIELYDLLCSIARTSMMPQEVKSLKKTINLLAQAQVIKSDDRLNGALGAFINVMKNAINN